MFDDNEWSEERWKGFLNELVDDKLLSWKEVASVITGQLNPVQVGTAVASAEGFKKHYGKGKVMETVMKWFYDQKGTCEDCGTRIELQVDHVKPKEEFEDVLEADYIDNIVLRCRRCNTVKRPSHKLGGKTFLTTESALMWIMFNYKPRTLLDFTRMCRVYGLTMSDIRMKEGWAMTHWLNNSKKHYEVDSGDKPCDIYLWPNGSLTRIWKGDTVPTDAKRIYEDVDSTLDICFVVNIGKDETVMFRKPIQYIPFSHYNNSDDLCIVYRDKSVQPLYKDDATIIKHKIINPEKDITLSVLDKVVNIGVSKKRKISNKALVSEAVEINEVSVHKTTDIEDLFET